MTMRKDEDEEAGTPWWVRAVYQLGVPTAIALFLLYFLTLNVSANLTALQESIRQHTVAASSDRAELRFYLRAICLRLSHDDAERTQCIAERDR